MTPEEQANFIMQQITDALFNNNCSITKQGVVAATIVCVEKILLVIGDEPYFMDTKAYWNQVLEILKAK